MSAHDTEAEQQVDDKPSATMIMTGVASIVANIDADYLAARIEEFYKEGGQGVIEIDDKTYINPAHIVTFGTAAPAPDERPKVVQVARSLPPGMTG